MFDLIRKNARLRYTMLGIVVVPLSFVGGNFLVGGGEAVVSVGSSEVTKEQFDYRYRNLLEDLRGRGLNVDALSPELEQGITSNLVSEMVSQLLQREATQRKSVVVTQEEVRAFIAGMEEFHAEDGSFSPEIFGSLVTNESDFIAQIREQVSLDRFNGWFDAGGVVSERSLSWYAAYLQQEREVSVAEYALDQFRESVSVSEADVEGYYSENLQDYIEEERGRALYFLFSLDDFAQSAEVSSEEIEQAYRDLEEAARETETRRVSHILVESAAEAEEVAGLARADPDGFAELAELRSQDAGSAVSGGDLGFVARGDLDPELDEAIYALEIGEVSEPVESSFGLHILKLTEVRSADPVTGFEEMKDEIAERVRREKVAVEFDELVGEINERLYLEVDRLAGVAAEYGLKVEETGWLKPVAAEEGEEDANPAPFNDASVLDVLFSAAHRQGESTELLPIGEDSFVAARFLEYFPTRQKEYAEVAEEVREAMIEAEAAKLAIDRVGSDVERLRDGEAVAISWSPSMKLNLVDDERPESLTEVDYDAIGRLDASEGYPAYTFTPGDGAIRLIRVESVDVIVPDDDTLETAKEEYIGQRGFVERLGYLENLAEDVPIAIRLDD